MSKGELAVQNGLTMKQFHFARLWFELGNASEAYRQAYDAENMSAQAIGVEAHKLTRHPKVALIVEEMREDAIAASRITYQKKQALLMKLAEYGLEEVVNESYQKVGKDGEISDGGKEYKQRNPTAAVAAIKELNLMDGHHAAIKQKLEIDNGQPTQDDIAMDYARQNFDMNQAQRLVQLTNVEKMGIHNAVELIKKEASGNIWSSD